MKTDMETFSFYCIFFVLDVDNHLAKFQIKSIATSISGEYAFNSTRFVCRNCSTVRQKITGSCVAAEKKSADLTPRT